MLTEMLLLAKNCLLASEMLSFVSSLVASSATKLPSPSIIPSNKFVIAKLSERRSLKYIVPRVSTKSTSAGQHSLIKHYGQLSYQSELPTVFAPTDIKTVSYESVSGQLGVESRWSKWFRGATRNDPGYLSLPAVGR